MELAQYHIVLEKGQAARPFYDLSESEKEEVGKKAFKTAALKAAEIGALPITRKTLQSKKLR